MPDSLVAAAEELAEVREAMLIDAGTRLLFVVMQPGKTLDNALRVAINDRARAMVPQPRLPDAIYVVPGLPRTLEGEKREAALRQVFMGTAPGGVSVANPEALRYFVDLFNNL